MLTRWGKALRADCVLPEYPRPSMVRNSYYNLNGWWRCAFTKGPDMPPAYPGRILVPFSPESELSGVKRQLQPKEYLWYQKRLRPSDIFPAEGGHLLLHFGAVDQCAAVYANGELIKEHVGGYLPFTAEIPPHARRGELELTVRVRDESDTSYHARGKQRLKAGGMFYTAQSGIWQTVWMEWVPDCYIKSLKLKPDYDSSTLWIRVRTNSRARLPVSVTVTAPGEGLALRVTGNSDGDIRVVVPDRQDWSPSRPFLYDVSVTLYEEDRRRAADRVTSYFAFRKIEAAEDAAGHMRLYLNGSPLIHHGVLDQGYYPDGLYTAPADEAMTEDILAMKRLGFNMLRKHLKVEPERWYYHCDRLGMMVWQDAVNGGSSYHSWFVTYFATAALWFRHKVRDVHRVLLSRTHKEGRRQYVAMLRAMLRHLHQHPSIVVWVPFNEGWGQFSTRQVTALIKRLDRTRLVDSASGWFDQGCGDFDSVHNYFFKIRFGNDGRVRALTEYGGYCWHVKEHSMARRVYGYRTCRSSRELTESYCDLLEQKLFTEVENGLSALVYTQLSDVEDEVNGLLTYDREMCKVDGEAVRRVNERLKGLIGTAVRPCE